MASTSTSFTTADALKEWLATHGVLAAESSAAYKSVDELWEEVCKGESVLKLEAGTPVRQVEVLNLFIINDQQQVLIEDKQDLPGGRSRSRGLPLSEKIMPGEDLAVAAARAVAEELGTVLGADAAAKVKLDSSSYYRVSRREPSHSYPGLTTEYTLHRVRAAVEGLPQEPFTTREEHTHGVLTSYWVWRPASEVLPPELTLGTGFKGRAEQQ